jgi:exosortase/archaeosortase
MQTISRQKLIDSILLILRIPLLFYFAYEVLFKDDVSRMGYLAAVIGFSIAAFHNFLNIWRKRQEKKKRAE